MDELSKTTTTVCNLNQWNKFIEKIGMKEYGYRSMSHNGDQQKKFYKKCFFICRKMLMNS